MRLLRHQINRYVRRNALWIIAGIALLMAGGAAAVGPVLTGEVRGGTALTVSQAVVIDRENLTVKDLRERTDDKAVAVNDDGTGLTVAAELHNGEVFVIDVPLANLSGADASVIATLHASPGVLKDIEVFWSTQTRDTTPTARTTTPSPSPVTSTSSQSSDTTPAHNGSHWDDGQQRTGLQRHLHHIFSRPAQQYPSDRRCWIYQRRADQLVGDNGPGRQRCIDEQPADRLVGDSGPGGECGIDELRADQFVGDSGPDCQCRIDQLRADRLVGDYGPDRQCHVHQRPAQRSPR